MNKLKETTEWASKKGLEPLLLQREETEKLWDALIYHLDLETRIVQHKYSYRLAVVHGSTGPTMAYFKIKSLTMLEGYLNSVWPEADAEHIIAFFSTTKKNFRK